MLAKSNEYEEAKQSAKIKMSLVVTDDYKQTFEITSCFMSIHLTYIMSVALC